ncbi:T9SS type A sorting domain-containing protein [Flavisolibacter sp. BT320]|nr:T9SS type A sorting domain-containing protein [Flavisolibacter longurius]
MKRLLLILSIYLVSTVSSQAQTRPLPLTGVQSSIVRFYPNPATSVINFDFQKDYEKGYSLQIFNAILGRKAYEQVNIPERMSVNLSEFSRGIYIYQLRDKGGRMVESGKFQVAK